MNWDTEALQVIKNGTLTVSVGGHFFIGGWVIVLLHDHAHGKDFADVGVHIEQPMFAITSANLDAYLEKFAEQRWDQIDFTRFSRVLNPQLPAYDFSLQAILEQQ